MMISGMHDDLSLFQHLGDSNLPYLIAVASWYHLSPVTIPAPFWS